jgi:hypothetical protein
MDAALQNAIALACSRLRKAFPELRGCEAAVDGIGDGRPRFSVRMDLRLPESQLLVCGAPAASVEDALEVAFDDARRRLEAKARLSPRSG